MDGRLGQVCPPKDTGHFLLKPLKAIALCLIPLTPLTLVLMVFWPGTVDAEKRLCRSSCVSLTPSFSLFLSLILCECLFYWLLCPLSAPPLHTHTHTPPLFSIHSFSHYWSVSALENCCACRAGVITSGINHFPCAWLQEARLIPALLYTPSRSTDREKAYWLLLKAWYNSKCLPICGRLCSFWPYNKGTKTERAEIQT